MSSHIQWLKRSELLEMVNDRGLVASDGNTTENLRCNTKGETRRKLSLPAHVTSSSKGTDERRNSDGGRVLGYHEDHLQSKALQDKNKNTSTSKQPSLDFEKADMFIPDVYLEAAKSPGSLREELKQIQTIDKVWQSNEVIPDPFQYFEGFNIEKL